MVNKKPHALKAYISLALKYNSAFLFLIVILKIVVNGINIIIPFLSKNIIDSVTIEKNYAFFQESIIFIISVLIGYLILSTITNIISIKYFLNIEKITKKDLFEQLLLKKIRFFKNYKPGEIVYRFEKDMNITISSWKTLFETIPVQLFLLTGSMFFMIKWNLTLAVVVVILVCLQTMVIVIFRKPILISSRKYQTAAEKINSFLVEAFSRINIIKEFIGNSFEITKYNKKLKEYIDRSLKKKLSVKHHQCC